MARTYTRGERNALEAALARGEEPDCPACGGTLARHPLPPSPVVPYVRRRVLLICASCRRSAAVDLRAAGPP